MPIVGSTIRTVLLIIMAGLALAGYANANESSVDNKISAGKEILILHSYHPGFPWTDEVMKGMQETLDNSGASINFHVEYLDTKRQPDPEYFTHVLDAILHYKLEHRFFDLVLVSDNEALNFVVEHKQDLFASTPIVFCGAEKDLPQFS